MRIVWRRWRQNRPGPDSIKFGQGLCMCPEYPVGKPRNLLQNRFAP